MAETKGKSPYTRYNKTPYRYSSEYEAWRANPSHGTAVAHARMLIRTFGRNYWNDSNRRPLFPIEAYR